MFTAYAKVVKCLLCLNVGRVTVYSHNKITIINRIIYISLLWSSLEKVRIEIRIPVNQIARVNIINQFLEIHQVGLRVLVGGCLPRTLDPWAVDRMKSPDHLHKVMVHGPWAMDGVNTPEHLHKIVVLGGSRRNTDGRYHGRANSYRSLRTMIEGGRIVWQMSDPLLAQIPAKHDKSRLERSGVSSLGSSHINPEVQAKPEVAPIKGHQLQVASGNEPRFMGSV
jgi:hypothetical protein